MDDLDDLLGDGHLDTIAGRQVQNRLAIFTPSSQVCFGLRDGLVDGSEPAPEVLTECAVSRQRRRACGDEVTDAGQTQERQWIGASAAPEAGTSPPAPRDQGPARSRRTPARTPCRWPAR